MNGLLQDIRYALRQLSKARAFTAFALLLMACGIGATTAMFSVIDAVLLKPLAYRDPERIVLITRSVTPIRFDEMKMASRSFSGLGTYSAGRVEQIVLSGTGAPVVLNGALVSANFLDILQVKPLAGRAFMGDEGKAGAPAAAIISHRLLQQRFEGDLQIIGKSVVLSGTPHTIVGVLAPGFQFPISGVDVWVPEPELSAISGQSRLLSPTLTVFGRLKPGVSLQQADAERVVLKEQYAAAHPGMLDAKLDAPETLVPLKENLVSDIRPKLWLLFGAVGLVLMIVCANIASLLLARASSRTREFAVRAAIGAGRTRIVRQLLVESVLLASVGGAAGILLASFGLSAIRSVTAIPLPRAGEIHLDVAAVAFAIALSTITGLIFGLAPAWAATRTGLADFLKGSGGTGSAPRTGKLPYSARSLLVVGQAAVSITLLIGASLLIQSLARLYRVDPGFQPSHLLTMQISLAPSRYATEEKQAAFYEQMVERLEAVPGVRNATVSLTLPFAGWAGAPVQPAAAPPLKLNERPISVIQMVSPQYFRTMGIALKRGRQFGAHDNLHSAPVAIINDALARRFWPQYPAGPDPVGQKLLMGANHPPKEIVGIAADVRQGRRNQEPPLGLYMPNAQVPAGFASIIVRTTGDPMSVSGAIQKQILALDPDQPVSDVKPMDEVAEASQGTLRLMMRLLAAFAGTATLLAMAGLYAVISFSVSRRTQEIGIRQALGAGRSNILSLIIAQGVRLAAAGVILGVCAAFALTRFLKDLVFQVNTTDPITFIGISILFVTVALLACYLPARRAAGVDPMVALRYE